MTVIDFLKLVPATFWGVIAGSFFTLIGITLTNRHDRATRDRQRQMDLRKEVYLAAAEAIAAGMLGLGRMANLDKQLKASNDFEKVAPAIAKVYVIGRIETINAVVAVQSELMSGFLRLMKYSMPIIILKNRITGLSSRIDSFLATQKDLLEQIGAEKLRGIPDQPKWDELQRQFKFETDRLTDAISEKAGIERGFADAQLTLSLRSIDESEKVTRLLPAAVGAIREELDLRFDQDAFGTILLRNFEQQRPIFGQIVSEAQQLISAASEQPPAPPTPPKP